MEWRRGDSKQSLGNWKVCRPVVADSHHFDEKPDPDPIQSEKSDPDPY